MATIVNFKGKNYIEPGAYAMTTYNPTSVVNVAEFGNVLVIDCGQGVVKIPNSVTDFEYARMVSNIDPYYSGGGDINQMTSNRMVKSKTTRGGIIDPDSINYAIFEFAGGDTLLTCIERKSTNMSIVENQNPDGFLYEFKNSEDFRNFVGGGEISDIVDNIFKPKTGSLGAPKVIYSRLFSAADRAYINIGNVGFTLDSDNNNRIVFSQDTVFKIVCKNAGYCGNAIYHLSFDDEEEISPNTFTLDKVFALYQGYIAYFDKVKEDEWHFVIRKGRMDWDKSFSNINVDEAQVSLKKYFYDILENTSDSYNGYPTNSYIVVDVELPDHPGVVTYGELMALLKSNSDFNSLFEIKVENDAYLTDNILVDYSFFYPSIGGNTVPAQFLSENPFISENPFKELSKVSELDLTFILPLFINDAYSDKLIYIEGIFEYFKTTDFKFSDFLMFSFGYENFDNDFVTDINSLIAHVKEMTMWFNSEQVVTCIGNPIEISRSGTKVILPSSHLLASIVGLNAGMAPQTPLTFKDVKYQSFFQNLSKEQRIELLQAGIMHMRNVSGRWRINQGVTTLQDNKKTIADDGQSFELSIALIKAQLNKELIIEGENRFIGNTAAQASPEAVKNFVETKLASFVATPGNDNLILDWKNVTVRAQNGDYFVTYDFVPNVPVNKTFFVGNILDFTF